MTSEKAIQKAPNQMNGFNYLNQDFLNVGAKQGSGTI